MAESTINLTYAKLQEQVGYLAGYDVSNVPTSLSSAQQARIDDVIQAGYRKFLYPPPIDGPAWQWSFMCPRYDLTLVAPYSTGTVTIVSGVVTLSGGTFPSTAAAGEVILLGEHYTVNTRDSGTQVTLDDTTVNAAAGSSYELVQTEYSLPDDFGWIEGNRITFEPAGNSTCLYGAERIGEQVLREYRMERYERSGVPEFYAIYPKTHTEDGTESVRYKMQFWPNPDAAYRSTFAYTRVPNVISASNDYFLGGAAHAETIREAVLSEAERVFNDQDGPHTALFQQRLAASVSFDRQSSSPATGGYNGDASDEWEVGFDPYRYRNRYFSNRVYAAP